MTIRPYWCGRSALQPLGSYHIIPTNLSRQSWASKRWASSFESGERKSGHILAGPNEGILYFNNVFPLSLSWLFRIPFVTGESAVPRLLNSSFLGDEPQRALTQAQVGLSKTDNKLPPVDPTAKIIQVLPRVKEGGAFVKFAYENGVTQEDVAEAVTKYLKEKNVRPALTPWQHITAELVRGKPWVEDLYRLPSQRVKVEFLPTSPGGEAAELSQEDLYAFFRPYGKLADIVPQPPDSKLTPKYAHLDFGRTGEAVMAKNCMHGYVVDESQGGGKSGTILRLSYDKKQKTRWIWDWLSGHTRIVIPLLAALVATITVTIFDPIRTFSIKTHITRSLHLDNYRIYRWLKGRTEDILNSVRRRYGLSDAVGMQAIWEDRRKFIQQIQKWLEEPAETFIVVQGPRGSGKKELVIDQALKDWQNKLIIDCKPIQDARGDSSVINAIAAEVGYRPVFSWMNSVSGLVDLAAQGATGIKTGFSETLENQLTKIWTNTSAALKQIALENRQKNDKDANLSDDEYLEQHPECRPVVVIDNFLYKNQDVGHFYDKISEWAASVVSSNIGHVIILTQDVSFSKSLAKALPDRVPRQIPLSDCSEEAAKRYVINHLDFGQPPDPNLNPNVKSPSIQDQRKDLAELDDVLPTLGGRLTDLESFARRIKAGETPHKATREIVEQAASDVQKILLGGTEDSRSWSPQQAWLLVKQLAKHDSLRYNEVLLSDAYKNNGDSALAALEQAELITIQSSGGRPYSIRPGRPVYFSAFRRLTHDAVLASKLDMIVLAEAIKNETATIDKCEQELHLIGELPKQPAELAGRVQWLLSKVQTSQLKVEGFERQTVGLKKILTSEY